MKTAFALATLLLPALAFQLPGDPAADSGWSPQIEAVETVEEVTPEPAVELVQESASQAPEPSFDEVLDELRQAAVDLRKGQQELAEAARAHKEAAEQPMKTQMPMGGVCECKCPSIDEIRNVIREELQTVKLTIRDEACAVKEQEVKVSDTGKAKALELQPGDRVVAIDGQPVQPYTVPHKTTGELMDYYSHPSYEVLAYPQRGIVRGAIRARSNSTCRIVNGVQVCN